MLERASDRLKCAHVRRLPRSDLSASCKAKWTLRPWGGRGREQAQRLCAGFRAALSLQGDLAGLCAHWRTLYRFAGARSALSRKRLTCCNEAFDSSVAYELSMITYGPR